MLPLDPATDHKLYKEGLASYQSYRKQPCRSRIWRMWSLKSKTRRSMVVSYFSLVLCYMYTWNIQENKSGYTREKICNLKDHCNDDCNSSLE